jgi:hypothetical protein
MFCPQCGSDNPAGTQFCTKCGAALSAPAAPPVRAGGQPAQQGLLAPKNVELSQYAIPLGGVLMFIGTFLPWVSFFGYSANGFNAGFRGIMVFLFSLVLIGGYVALRMMPTLWDIPNIRLYLVIALGAIALLSLIFAASVGGGFGAILVILGALIAAVGGIWVWFKQ